jgi:hypothetical protein
VGNTCDIGKVVLTLADNWYAANNDKLVPTMLRPILERLQDVFRVNAIALRPLFPCLEYPTRRLLETFTRWIFADEFE